MAKTIVQAGLFQAETEEKALAQATMAVLQGLELGIAPMQAAQQIAIIGGRCVIWGDLVPALIWRAGHKIKEWIEGDGDARVAWCEITRGDNQEVIKRKFSVDDAKRAGLWDVRATIKRKDKTDSWQEEDNDSPWFRHRERMLQMRARGFCARDGAPDALRGLYIREEMKDEEEAPREKGRYREAQDKSTKASIEVLVPPPAPPEKPETPSKPEEPAKPSGGFPPPAPTEAAEDLSDFLSDLDVSLAACKTNDQLDEVWEENLETVCGLGMQLRQKAELMYDRHRSRILGRMHLMVEAAERQAGAAA